MIYLRNIQLIVPRHREGRYLYFIRMEYWQTVVMENTNSYGYSQGRGCNYGPWSEWRTGLEWINEPVVWIRASRTQKV